MQLGDEVAIEIINQQAVVQTWPDNRDDRPHQFPHHASLIAARGTNAQQVAVRRFARQIKPSPSNSSVRSRCESLNSSSLERFGLLTYFSQNVIRVQKKPQTNIPDTFPRSVTLSKDRPGLTETPYVMAFEVHFLPMAPHCLSHPPLHPGIPSGGDARRPTSVE